LYLLAGALVVEQSFAAHEGDQTRGVGFQTGVIYEHQQSLQLFAQKR
jgi:hypothetical protein